MDYNNRNSRPLLKGVFHLIATVFYIIAFPFLLKLIPKTIKFPLILYLCAIIGNFGASTLLHLPQWSEDIVVYPRRLDHIMIFVKIAATYCAAIVTIMPDINLLVKYTLCIGSILGIIMRVFFTDAPTLLIGLPYLLVGWSIILDPTTLLTVPKRIPIGSIFAVLAGISYTIGAIIYITKYPRVWPKSLESRLDPKHILPKYMGYHELFHIFAIIGAVFFTICIFGHGIPYYNHKLLQLLPS